MPNLIQTKGSNQTFYYNNNDGPHFHELKWNADYDGDVANVKLLSNIDGNKQKYGAQLDNEDLANILNVSSINMPLHKRLRNDFIKNPKIMQIELAPQEQMTLPQQMTSELEDLLQSATPTNYLSTPASNEELIVPITIGENTTDNFTLTPRRHHRRRKHHKTYKVYKKIKSTTHNSSRHHSKSKTKSKSKIHSSKKFTIF